jgi:diguanylate cyclase (GGDEF)-like protein/PAS domain S-box-containing protein
MLRVLTCITQEHDLRLVILAGLICLFACYTGFSLIARVRRTATPRRQFYWIAAAAFATGSGVWATHFIAMLAFQPNLPVGYEIDATLFSIAVAVGFSGLGFWVADRGSRRAGIIGGAIAGTGISAMHYTGMTAFEVPGRLAYDGGMVLASLVIGIALGAVAIDHGLRHRHLKGRWIAAATFALGICGMHFTGMAAAEITPDPTVAVSSDTIAAGWLAVVITAVTILILALSLAGAILDQHLVTRHEAEQERLRQSEIRFRQLADATFEGILIHRDGVILDANEAMCALTGRPLAQLAGHRVMDIVAEASHAALQAKFAVARENGSDTHIEIELRHTDGSTIPVEILGRAIRTSEAARTEDNLRVVAMRDLRERKEAEELIRYMANHDGLTDLPNRNLFQDRLGQALARSKRGASTCGVLCLDLDRFKNVNDLNGHAMGDELLRQVAQRLTASVRADDTVARLSGDEFAIIQVGVAHPDGPAILADRLVKAMAAPFEIDGQQTIIGTSIGIALYPGDGDSGEELMRAADTALYRAKAAGRGTYRFFEAEMDVRLQERRRLERDLRQALASHELDVHFQPLVGCDSEQVIGFEALVRWNHAERGFVSPAEFIPLAEECGLIMPLGNWVLRAACREAITWPAETIVAVNISPAQFRHADLAKEVLGVLADIGLAAHRLELEITEGVLIEDTERVLETLTRLKQAGVRISLDDFGTGYSSLSYLQRFPFDKIKIDRSFIWEMEKNPDSMSIVRAVIALGRSLRITVTAEGVETPTQLALLQSEHCDQVQGYLIGKPLPRAEASALLANPEALLGLKLAAQ